MIKLNQRKDKIRDDWNALKPREKREIVSNDPERAEKIKNKMYEGGYIKEGKEIISIENRSLGIKGQNLKKANKKEHEDMLKETKRKQREKDERQFAKIRAKREEKLKALPLKNADRKLKRDMKKHGLTMNTQKLLQEGIPNTEALKMGKKNFIKTRKQMNELQKRMGNGITDEELERLADKEWADAMEQVRIVNTTPDYVGAIKRKAIEDNKNWLELKFFKDARTENQYQRIINEYLKHLPIDKLNDIISVLTDPRFLKEWDSDQESDESNADKKTERQWDFIKMLRNETGKDIFVDAKNPHGKLITKKWKDDGSVWRFSNFN